MSGAWADDEVDATEIAAAKAAEEAKDNDDFPSLAQAAKVPPKAPAKKKKGQKMGLGELIQQVQTAPSSGRRDGPMSEREILMSLPTSSRGKVDGEGDSRPGLGGGFKEYGGERGGRRGGDERYGGRDRDGFGPPPSRADEVSDWGSTRQFQPSSGGGGFGDRRGPGGGGFRDRDGPGGGGFRDRDGPGREPRPPGPADEVDDWGKNKKYEPAADERRGGGFGGGGGFRDRDGPRGGPPRPMDRADMEDQWGRGREFQRTEPEPRHSSGSRNYGFAEAPRSAADAENRWVRRAPVEPASTSASSSPPPPAERPRLKLAPRTVPVESNGPAAAQSPENGAAAQPKKPSANPFGAARPREDVLKEKGVEPSKDAAETGTSAQPAAPAAQTQSAFPSYESKEELKLRESITQMHQEKDEMEDPDDKAEVQKAIDECEAKLKELRIEREAREAKARELAAASEAEGGSWVAAKPSKAKAAEAAPPPAPAAANGSARGGHGRGGSGGRGQDGAPPQRDNRGPPPGRGVAAGAPNVERKW